MKLGILEADQLSAEIVQVFGSYGTQFRQLFHSIEPSLQLETFDVIGGHYPTDIKQCDGYLITGSQFSVYDAAPWIERLQNFVKELHQAKIPLIGICFGHQLIAHTLGGKTIKSHKGWGVGLTQFQITESKDWMTDFKQSFSLLTSHQDQVVELPLDAQVVAKSSFCPNAALQISDHILSFQGHPEFTSDYLKILLNKRRTQIGETRYQTAIKSLNKVVDSKLIARWILDFLNSTLK